MKVPRPSARHIEQIPAKVRFSIFGWRATPPPEPTQEQADDEDTGKTPGGASK